MDDDCSVPSTRNYVFVCYHERKTELHLESKKLICKLCKWLSDIFKLLTWILVFPRKISDSWFDIRVRCRRSREFYKCFRCFCLSSRWGSASCVGRTQLIRNGQMREDSIWIGWKKYKWLSALLWMIVRLLLLHDLIVLLLLLLMRNKLLLRLLSIHRAKLHLCFILGNLWLGVPLDTISRFYRRYLSCVLIRARRLLKVMMLLHRIHLIISSIDRISGVIIIIIIITIAYSNRELIVSERK